MGNNLEVWKPLPIEGFGDGYAVSNYGRVRALDRWITSNGRIKLSEGHLLKPNICGAGYEFYSFSYNKKQVKEYTHRLVAMAFIPNPDGLPEINHKDLNPLNNRYDNLEWCTHLYNMRYMKGEIKRHRTRPVEQLTRDGELVARYESIADAQRKLGYGSNLIYACCRHRETTAHGYVWRYALEE